MSCALSPLDMGNQTDNWYYTYALHWNYFVDFAHHFRKICFHIQKMENNHKICTERATLTRATLILLWLKKITSFYKVYFTCVHVPSKSQQSDQNNRWTLLQSITTGEKKEKRKKNYLDNKGISNCKTATPVWHQSGVHHSTVEKLTTKSCNSFLEHFELHSRCANHPSIGLMEEHLDRRGLSQPHAGFKSPQQCTTDVASKKPEKWLL